MLAARAELLDLGESGETYRIGPEWIEVSLWLGLARANFLLIWLFSLLPLPSENSKAKLPASDSFSFTPTLSSIFDPCFSSAPSACYKHCLNSEVWTTSSTYLS